MSSIYLENVKKSFGNVEIINGIDLDIKDGKCTVLVGPSGCGKSTLLRMICGLEEATSGNIFIDGKCVNDIPASHRGLAMVFQSYALYPHMSVFENMSFALKVRKLPKNEIKNRVIRAANILKIDDLLDRKPKELSGGQRQRVAIGRCIVRSPSAFLFDEPLSNLDASLRHQMRYELAKLKEQLETTMIYVTHDQEEAMTLADQIVVMRSGRVEQIGSPLDIYNNPANTFVASFIGTPTMNILNVELLSCENNIVKFLLGSGDVLELIGQHDKFKSKKYTIGIRPEDVHIEGFDNASSYLQATITFIENLGGLAYIYASLPMGQQINIQIKGMHSYCVGSVINIKICKFYLFSSNGQACSD